MSSSPTDRTSTTGSSTSSPSRADRGRGELRSGAEGPRIALVTCGAIANPTASVIARRGWPVDIHPLPPLLHNQPQLIADQVRTLAIELSASYDAVAVGYADCGTYGALDVVCDELGLKRLPGLHCYDLFDGSAALAQRLGDEPGAYLFTDFLVRSFERTVVRELGLDRYPELRDDYFRHYTRVVCVAQEHDAELRTMAQSAAELMVLPLTFLPTGTV